MPLARILAGATLALLLLAGGALAWLLAQPRPGTVALPDAALPGWPPAGTTPLRLVAFGTSLTARYGWPQALAARLAECLGRPVTAEVVAGPGMGSAWGVSQLGRVRAAAPDLVLVEFATNDSDLRLGVGLAAARANHEAIIAGLREGGARPAVLLLTMNPAFGLRGLSRPFLAAHNAQAAALARVHGAGFVDLAPRWQAAIAAGGRENLVPDGLHPAEAAQTRIMLDGLRPALCPPG